MNGVTLGFTGDKQMARGTGDTLMALFKDWRVLVLITVFSWGLWGFLAKVASVKLNWQTLCLYVGVAMTAVILAACITRATFTPDRSHFLALLAGIFAGVGSLSFYKAIEKAPASVVIPISTQYIILTVILSTLILHEPLLIRRIIGLLFGIMAIILLSL